MLQAVPAVADERHDYMTHAYRTFGSIAAKAQRAQELSQMPRSLGEHQTTAQLEARDMIRELLSLAELPTYAAALRVLNEVRRELRTLSMRGPVDVPGLCRNLDLFLDGQPEQ